VAVSTVARAADALLEASVIGGFSRIGLAARSRLLPEFTAGARARLDGRTVVITGATSGIGHATATRLAGLGAEVHFLARDPGRAAAACGRIAAASGSRQVSYGLADLNEPGSVRSFAAEYLSTHDRLDVLIHNAGALHASYRVNGAGTELTVAGQVIAPFLLTSLLLPALRAAGRSRVITVSSAGMYTQRLDPVALQMTALRYRGVTAYARAKRAQVALSREWARRLAGTGVVFHAMHPGWVDTAGIAAALPRFHRVMWPLLRTPGEGADTIVWLATADPVRLGSGRFWHDRRPRAEHRLPWTREAPGAGQMLWDRIESAERLDLTRALR